MNRRQLLKGLGAAGLFPLAGSAADAALQLAGRDVEIQISSISQHTVRIAILPLPLAPAPDDGSLLETSLAPAAARFRTSRAQTIRTTSGKVAFSADPFSFAIETTKGDRIQQFRIDPKTGAIHFEKSAGPLLGLGQGGPQFDHRGSTDRMKSGSGGFELRTHGSRVPIPWLIGTSPGAMNWAIFFHQPYGSFDFTGSECIFNPGSANLPIDFFVATSPEPAVLMAEYARLTGHPELPPLWSFGYQQSHRTLASREEILAETRMFREKKLPCDTMIYLGTGFCPSGWNTNNGEFTFNPKVFPDPKAIIDEMHREHFKVVLHAVIEAHKMHGTVRDACDPQSPVEEQPSCYWAKHREVFATGVDGWWPDEGDSLDPASRLARNRMYWEAPQLDRPKERPFALHRNGYAGMQRYAAFLWSGDVSSLWETLRTHVPIAINTGLSGIPYWGTDIGGFVTTKEFTAELYLRWFQFGAFCPLFRAHGRTWKLRLPWGWNTGDPGPVEIGSSKETAVPDASQLHNAAVEPICRKYLELRYRMLPYLYSAVHESTLTGMPIMRAMWLHYPNDPEAARRGDQYLWGRDVLVAPVVDEGASSRTLYLPRGDWFDVWTGQRHIGGREITRKVDLETMPLYVRAGAILPLGPVKQYVYEDADGPLNVTVYPGADGSFLLYEDDGKSFDYRAGAWMGIQFHWSDARRVLTLRLEGRMLPPPRREIVVKLGEASQTIVFNGHPRQIHF